MDKKLKTNAIFNLIYQMMAIIIPLITMPYLARVLGVDNIGIQSYTLSIVSYFTLFAAFGLNDYGQREIARNQEDKGKISKLFFELIANRFLTGFIVVSVYLTLVFTVFEAQYEVYYLILVMNILAITFDVAWFFQGIENFKSLAIRNTIVKLVSMTLIFIFVKDSNSLGIYIFISSMALILSSLSVWVMLPKYIVKTKIEFKNIFKHFKGSLVYFIPTIAIQIYTVLDKSMIQWITNSNFQNGIYDQAERIVKVSLTIIQFMNVIMCSRMSFLFANNREEEAKSICTQSLRFLSFFVFPIALGIVLIANNIIPLYLGPGYEDSILLLQCFSLLVIFIAISGFVGSHYMTPTGQQGKSNIALIIGAIVNLILNLILIKPLGALGATIASVSAEGLIAVLYIYNGRKFFKVSEYFKIFFKNIIAAIIMFVVVYFSTNSLSFNNLSMILIKMSIGVVTYLAILAILRDNYLLSTIDKLKNKILNRD